MTKSSIHIVPVKPGSEAHNNREKEFDYVRKDLTPLNESWSLEPINERLKKIKERYTKTVGRRMHSKSTPIREGVCNLGPDTGMKELHEMRISLKEKFGINAFQIHIHRDEGHYKKDDPKKWYPNLHAHVVFDWTDSETGKSIKLDRDQMSEVQTLVANTLKMERGVSSDKKHVSAIAYKHQKRIEELEQIISKYDSWNKGLSKLRSEIENARDALVNKNRLGSVDKEKTLQNIESILLENKKLADRLAKEKTSVYQIGKQSQEQEARYMKVITKMEGIIKGVESKITEVFKCPEESRMKLLKQHFPQVHRVLNEGKDRGKSLGQ